MIVGGTRISRHRPLPASHASEPSSQAAAKGAAMQTTATISDTHRRLGRAIQRSNNEGAAFTLRLPDAQAWRPAPSVRLQEALRVISGSVAELRPEGTYTLAQLAGDRRPQPGGQSIVTPRH